MVRRGIEHVHVNGEEEQRKERVNGVFFPPAALPTPTPPPPPLPEAVLKDEVARTTIKMYIKYF